jgi:plastocyanin
MRLTRRQLLGAGVGLLAGAPLGRAAAKPVEIRMLSDPSGAIVRFDPIGLLVQPGQILRWRCVANVHTTTAYHPGNAGHSLRIPEGAPPWNSDYLLPGETFEVTLTIEGVYDYFCVPHEMAGMVGRIIVGRPEGPGTRPFDPSVPEAARAAFPEIGRIMAERVVHPT